MPQFPPLPATADRHEEREWKNARREALRDWRSAVKDQRRMTRDQWRDDLVEGAMTRGGRSEEQLISRFKTSLVVSGGVILLLGVINVANDGFPWVIFPRSASRWVQSGVTRGCAGVASRGARIWGSEDPDEHRQPGDPDGMLPSPSASSVWREGSSDM
jgi:hypothetical protein